MLISQDKRNEVFFFDKVAKQQGVCELVDESYYTYIFQLFQLNDGCSLTILDVGCGSGAFGLQLANQGHVVVGVDLSREMIESTRDRLRLYPISRGDLSVVLADAENLPFRDETFDASFCHEILHHFKKLEVVVKELSRAVRVGGRLMLTEPNGSNPVKHLSKITRRFIPRRLIVSRCIATLNETPHKISHYSKLILNYGFTCTKIVSVPAWSSNKDGNLKNIIAALVMLRMLLYRLTWKMLPQPFGGIDVAISAKKVHSEADAPRWR